MKKFTLLLLIFLSCKIALPQRALDISISDLITRLNLPSAKADVAFRQCRIGKGERKQAIIGNYGDDLVQQDSFIAQTTRKLNETFATGISTAAPQMPSQEDIDATKSMAEKLKSMTPDQQKEWAMQMAQQKNANSSGNQESGTNMQLVMQAQGIAAGQLTTLNREFNAKWLALNQAHDEEFAKVPRADYSACPQDQTGLADCGCQNKSDLVRLKKLMAIREKYNQKRLDLIGEYLPTMKNLAASVDKNIVALKNGDALKTVNFKRQLVSIQASAFAGSYAALANCGKEIRKSGSDIYSDVHNAENGLYAPCGVGK